VGKGGKETVRGEVKVFLVWRVCACGMNRMKDSILNGRKTKHSFFFSFRFAHTILQGVVCSTC